MSSVKPIFKNAILPLRYADIWFRVGLTLLAIVLVVSLVPGAKKQLMLSDKTIHFLTFTLLTIWFCGIVRFRLSGWIIAGLFLFGILIEVLQSRVPYRSAEFADLLSDVGGILLGWALSAVGLRRWPAMIESWITTKKPI